MSDRVLFVLPPENINLLTGKPRAGVVPAPVPTEAEHVLLAQAVVRKPRLRKRDAIGRAWNALGAWLEQPFLPLPSVRRASRYPRQVVRRLVPYALVLVACLPLLAVEAGVWRVGP